MRPSLPPYTLLAYKRMDISSITSGNSAELDLKQLRAFRTLYQAGTLTRAAQMLNVTQPAMSKTLAQLRRHFGDPLFTRVGHRMQPTARALELEPEISAILDQVLMLRTRHVPFDISRAARVFKFCVVDSGLVRLLPPLIAKLQREAPGIRLRVVNIAEQEIEPSLEAGNLDFAMGSYPGMSAKVRRQALWSVSYASAVCTDHPRVRKPPGRVEFADELHVLVSTAGSGHEHRKAERALLRAIPAEKVVCTVPSFVTAAFVASETDAIATLPATLLGAVAQKLGLRVFDTPIALPKIQISQYWHERFHRDPANRWIRGLFSELFGSAD